MNKIAIVGTGFIGHTVASMICKQEHDIILIEPKQMETKEFAKQLVEGTETELKYLSNELDHEFITWGNKKLPKEHVKPLNHNCKKKSKARAKNKAGRKANRKR